MHIQIRLIGRLQSTTFEPLLADYTKRLPRNIEVEWKWLKPSSHSNPSQAVAAESTDLLQGIGTRKVVLFDEIGQQCSSVELADMVQQWQLQAQDMVWIIGGAFGVDDSVKSRADITLALSKLTLPHKFVPLLVIEQLYRATAIASGSKYHHV